MNLIVSCFFALLPWQQPVGSPAATGCQHIECVALPAATLSGVRAVPAITMARSGALGIPLLFLLTRNQWGLAIAATLLLILGLLRLDLLYKRRKDRHHLQRMQVEYVAMQQSVSRLEQLEAALRQQMRIQERLITAILHDVKSPLYYLLISARALSNRITETRDGVQADAHAFYDATYRMYHLLDNLLQYVKLHAQNKHNVHEPIALRELVAEKISIFENIANAKNICIENGVDAALTLQSDRAMLAIILHNLLDNAIKFTEAGKVRIVANVSGDDVRLEIADSGVGMPARWVSWVNEPIGTAREPLLPSLPAENGLGLIIVKELLAEINGRLHMNSDSHGTIAQVIVGHG